MHSLKDIYGKNAPLQAQRYEGLSREFARRFENAPKAQFFRAPGRTELCGNHTDHQKGRVLAAAVEDDIAAAAEKNGTNTAHLFSPEYGEFSVNFDRLDPLTQEVGTSAALVRGVAARMKELGYLIGGFDACLSSRVPVGSGLSSSAAFEVLMGNILGHLFGDGVEPVEAAKIGQFSENRYFGKPCGLMDQLASSVGGPCMMDFKTDEPSIDRLDFDFARHGYVLCMTATGGSHENLTEDYAAIPNEMGLIAAHFGKRVLREVSFDAFQGDIKVLREKTGDRAVLRALHFFGENERVIKERDALSAADMNAFLDLMIESGRSSYELLQNIYSPAHPAQQGLSLALALAQSLLMGRGAWRVHGGGFAGAIQAVLPADDLPLYRMKIEAVFGENSCRVLSLSSFGGCAVGL